MSELLDWILQKENKKTCRIVGLILTILPLIFLLGGGFHARIDGKGIIFSSGWFREIFMIVITFMLLFGIILIVAGFSKKISDDDPT